MLYLKTIQEKIVSNEITLEFPLIDKYFWCSRSVYAVEFISDIYCTEEDEEEEKEIWYEMKLIEVQFENNIIHSFKTQWCKKHPFTVSRFRCNWERELFDAYINNRYDSRTKEQFEADFNRVIANLQELRLWRYKKE